MWRCLLITGICFVPFIIRYIVECKKEKECTAQQAYVNYIEQVDKALESGELKLRTIDKYTDSYDAKTVMDEIDQGIIKVVIEETNKEIERDSR